MKKVFRLFAILFHIVLFIALSLFILYPRFQPVAYIPAVYAEDSAILDNPYCGFYRMYGFALSEDDPESAAQRCRQYIDWSNGKLIMLQINLKNYSETDLSETALQQLDRILGELSAAKREVILRFFYDWDGNALETEPSEITTITRHMDQLAEVINRYADTVYLIQSTFTGNYGEMTQTHYGSHANNRFLMAHLAEVTDPSIFLAVRTPSHLRGVTESKTPITPETAFDGTLSSRLGLYNDGILGSVYDVGTYDDTSFAGSTNPAEKGTREEELAFQEYLCQYVPNGGETVIDNPYNDLENAVVDLARMHVSYLNSAHDTAVLEKWQASTYESKDCFNGMNGLDYITAHLCYRFVVTDSSFSYDALKSDTASYTFTLQNTGFAPSYRNFDGKLTLCQAETNIEISIPLELDTRTIMAGSAAAFTYALDVRSLPAGIYEAFFILTDPYTGRTIQLANKGIETDGSMALGSFIVESTENGAAWKAFLEALPSLLHTDRAAEL